ncbi:MAG: phosphate starvation-inducible protein PhoH, partial [Hyphomicrobiales bacterium]|nr:phosphate starvation-inducible protein PhoH [Hyphomicrobiales bacterium]
MKTPENQAAGAAGPEIAEIAVAFDDNKLASRVFGHYDQNLALIERRLGVVAAANGNLVTLKGPRANCERAKRVVDLLAARARQGQPATQGDVEGAIQEGAMQGSLFTRGEGGGDGGFDRVSTRKRGTVRARN